VEFDASMEFPYVARILAPTPVPARRCRRIEETILGPTLYAMIDDRFYIEAVASAAFSDSMLDKVRPERR